MASERLEDLWDRFLDGGTLTADEERELVGALSSDEALRRASLDDDAMHGLLQAAHFGEREAEEATRDLVERLSAERDQHRFAASLERRLGLRAPARESTPPTRGRRARGAVWAVAAAAAAAIVIVGVGLRGRLSHAPESASPSRAGDLAGAAGRPDERPAGASGSAPSPGGLTARRAPAARVAEAAGAVFALEHGRKLPVGEGALLLEGQGILTAGAGSRTRLVLGDGTVLSLDAWGVISALSGADGSRGRSLFLAAGRLRAEVAPQPAERPFVFGTPHGEAVVLGTKLTLTVTSESTALEVEQGSVRLAAIGDTEGAAVWPGQRSEIGRAKRAAASAAPPPGPRMEPGSGKNVALLVVGAADPLDRGDELIARRLETLGFAVDLRKHDAAVGAQAAQAALVFISSSAGSAVVGARYRDLPVPVVVAEADIFDAMGMTPERQSAKGRGTTGPIAPQVTIKSPLHRLAAGLSGATRVANGNVRMGWGSPGPLAAWIATLDGHPDRAAVFGYEKGAPMFTRDAPARRVGLFATHEAMPELTSSGWALVDAAISWAVGP